jgi:hypothetical protein
MFALMLWLSRRRVAKAHRLRAHADAILRHEVQFWERMVRRRGGTIPALTPPITAEQRLRNARVKARMIRARRVREWEATGGKAVLSAGQRELEDRFICREMERHALQALRRCGQ